MSLHRQSVKVGAVRSPLRVFWPHTLVSSADEGADKLYSLFPDHDPKLVSESNGGWEFHLDWPSHLLEHTDPQLEICAREHYGLRLEDLAGYTEVRRCGRADFVFSMFHSRALLAPALAAARAGGRFPRTIVHVDAHSDLGAPLLTVSAPGKLIAPAFGMECDLADPDTVVHAINAGLVHKGSFLAAYLLATPPGELFHVWDEGTIESDYLVSQTACAKVGVHLVEHHQLVSSSQSGPQQWRRHKTALLPPHLSDQPGGVWLDVDLDAFCNRFDGDSDRGMEASSPVEVGCLRSRVEAFLEQLTTASWRDRIEAVSVAASPGFFPAEYWEEIIPKVCDGIDEVLSTP